MNDGIARITLAGPDRMNVLDSNTLRILAAMLEGLDADSRVRAVIITGEKNFCAGADIREMRDMTPGEAEAFSGLGRSVLKRLEYLSQPVVAAVCGFALGGGCELALACDIRIADETARFGQPEVNLGLIPGFGGTQRLARVVGPARARELILTGRIFDAREAAHMGLVTGLAKSGELSRLAEETAILLTQKSPHAIRTIKEVYRDDRELEDGLTRETEAFAACFASPDRIEGISAFLEKRAPRFEP
jgi:enoyl-CoA hydratase